MTKPSNRPAMVFALLFAAALLLVALRSGAFDPATPKGLTRDPCPEEYRSQSELVWAALTGEADRRAMRDWGHLCAFRNENAALAGRPVRAVLIGDSITRQWQSADPALFEGQLVNRGLGGEVSPQVLLRFYQDTVSLKPRVIHLMVGVNDISGFQGPSSVDAIRNNIRAMVDIAKANGTPVALGSITPVRSGTGGLHVAQVDQILDFNRWLKSFAAERGLVYADYHAILAEASGELKAPFSVDGVHLTAAAYGAMRPVLEDALGRAEKQSISARP